MGNMINFGIDLGTTNSVIAKFDRGEVKVFRDPVSWKDSLPSVVAFRQDRVIVGTKAKERMEKDPRNVVGIFKRKMGTSETFDIKALGGTQTPIDLSAQVLKHLKSFVEGEEVDEAVVTIPASFDTIQSNATKEAGKLAGFKQVVLLQEPIAASLSYANEARDTDLANSKWMVYDLGGGTFDVALVRIQDGEMRILDHEGDNFLGGADFDQLIVDKIIIPHLEKAGTFKNLVEEMKSAAGKYNSYYYVCLHKSEQAKIELSAQQATEIEILLEDDLGNEIDTVIDITRTEFEALIQPFIQNTVKMVRNILERNKLSALDLRFVLMVGGSTYIPFVRKTVEEDLQIEVNCNMDPTTAVAIGAAYYAGTKQKATKKSKISLEKKAKFAVKMAYQKVSKEEDEFFAARFDGEIDGHTYRITRDDSGFDTGIKPLKKQINEELPLVANAYNFFRLVIFAKDGNQVVTDAEAIGIAHGIYGVEGQPLPHDIAIEVDDLENEGNTRLELIFAKNNVLPLKKTITKTLNKSISKGSTDGLRINILEGPHTVLPEANLSIGFMEIQGTDLHRDVSKGSDIEITLEVSEDRDVSVSAYLSMSDQEFRQIFNPKERNTPINLLKEQVAELKQKLDIEYNEAVQREDVSTTKALEELKPEMSKVAAETSALTEDDVTDKRYQLEDRKRKLAQEIDNATRTKRVLIAKREYEEAKARCKEYLDKYGNEYEKRAFQEIESQEEALFASDSPMRIREKSDELGIIMVQIMWRAPDFLISVFQDLSQHRVLNQDNPDKVQNLVDAGKDAIEKENWNRLGEICRALLAYLPQNERQVMQTKVGF